MGDKEALDYLDVGIGIIGFFTFAFLVVTVAAELTGADALGWALTLLVFVLILGALLMARRRKVSGRQPAEPPESTTTEQ
jgi:LPXTG-motif cell wall-anchored protein